LAEGKFPRAAGSTAGCRRSGDAIAGGSVPPITEQSQTHHGDIMTVDDNPADLELLEEMLRQKGHKVRSFLLGGLALEAAALNPPDLILLDIKMPEMNGYEVCERLKSTGNLSDISLSFSLAP
jgi:CheY-like chemotaxis protein